MSDSFLTLFPKLGYRFRDEATLTEALTHRSAGSSNNERLEFLGDALLNWVIAEDLYQRNSRATEGELTRLRASLVNEPTLADIAQQLRLGEYLKMGSKERRSGDFCRQSVLADTFEALVGAAFLDGGVGAARELIQHVYRDRLEHLPDPDTLKDSKTRLQELLQARGLPLPVYEVVEISGEAHRQIFRVRCATAAGDRATEGSGSTRRQAEQAAAKTLLQQLS